MTPEAFRYQFRNVLKDLPKIALLGLRGDRSTSNRNDISSLYDDTIIRYLDGEIKEFQASVDPGRYYVTHPVNPHGCAKLKCGIWQYMLGEHHTHKALVQAEEVAVERLDKLGKRIGQESGWFGLNVHSGGPEYLIGRYSAGCQIIKTSEAWKNEWNDFFNPILTAIEIFKQTRIPYLLVDKLDPIPLSDSEVKSV